MEIYASSSRRGAKKLVRWEYCDAVRRNLGLTIERKDEDLVELMDHLGGHPLAMRAILPRLEKMRAVEILAAIRSDIGALGAEEDETLARVYATLEFAQRSLPAELQQLLVPLGLHENFVDPNYLENMAKGAENMANGADPSCTRAQIDGLLQALSVAGLLQPLGKIMYRMHPLLTSYLRSPAAPRVEGESRERWTRAFVDFMAAYASQLTRQELHEQKNHFNVHGENFHRALDDAEKLGMGTAATALTESIAMFALNSHDFAEAARLYEHLAAVRKKADDAEYEAIAYGQLGLIALEQRHFDASEGWYLKALEIAKRTGHESNTAKIFRQLGVLAQQRGKLDDAREWYEKSASLEQTLKDEDSGAATTYHQLGILSQLQGKIAEAEGWYQRALDIAEKLAVEPAVARTSYQLGMIADERGDFEKAGEWYRRSLDIDTKLGEEQGRARALGQLGNLDVRVGEFASAERHFLQSIAISESRRDFNAAAYVYRNFGFLEFEKGNFLDSGRWFIKSILTFRATHDPAGSVEGTRSFLVALREAPDGDKTKLRAMWREAGLEPLQEDEDQDLTLERILARLGSSSFPKMRSKT